MPVAQPKIVVFTGAGMSAESGIATFRDANGLWENHRVEDVASPEGWARNPDLVRQFYNDRYLNMQQAKPNEGHLGLAQLERYFNVQIITQNVDDLHERAGSTQVLHLHGQLGLMCSTKNRMLKAPYEHPLTAESKSPDGGLWRPDIVWFGEEVPNYPIACEMAEEANVFVVIGSSLQVNPAAMVVHYAADDAMKYLIDPNWDEPMQGFTVIKESAGAGVQKLKQELFAYYQVN